MKRNLHKKGLLEADPYLIAILEVIRPQLARFKRFMATVRGYGRLGRGWYSYTTIAEYQ